MKSYKSQSQKQLIPIDSGQNYLFPKTNKDINNTQQDSEMNIYLKLLMDSLAPQIDYSGLSDSTKSENQNIQVKTEQNTIIVPVNQNILVPKKEGYKECFKNNQSKSQYERQSQGSMIDQSSKQSIESNYNINSRNEYLSDLISTIYGNSLLNMLNPQNSIISPQNNIYNNQNNISFTSNKGQNNNFNKNNILSYQDNSYINNLQNLVNGYTSLAAIYNQNNLFKQENVQNTNIKQEANVEKNNYKTQLIQSLAKPPKQEQQQYENSESNGIEEKQENKKNDPKETHNIIQQVIPLFIDRLKIRCKDMQLNSSFLKLLERRSFTKSLQYFNQICQVIQEESEQNKSPLSQIAYQILEYDLAQWARNSKNIETACLYFKYQSAFILILKNPGVFSSIKVARKAHSKKMDQFMGKQVKI